MDLSTVLEAAVVLAGIVWAVAEIRGTTRELRLSIDNLSGHINQLDNTLSEVEKRGHEHETRLRLLEARDAG
jgi:hypothetical protein